MRARSRPRTERGPQERRTEESQGLVRGRASPLVVRGLTGQWMVRLQSGTAAMATHLRLQASRKRARIKRTAGYSSAVEGGMRAGFSILTIFAVVVVIIVSLKLFGLY